MTRLDGTWRTLLFASLLILVACQKQQTPLPPEEISNPLFLKMDSSQTGINFRNRVEESAEFNVLTYRNFYNGGGVGIGDLNADGWPDLYFTANTADNHLYLNRGNWNFEDVTASAGVAGSKSWSTGVAFADINGDGWLDIYVCNSGDIAGDNKTNELFLNLGVTTPGEVPRFQEVAASYGLADSGFSTHASFFDYDLDGDLDCYLLNNSFKDPSRIDLYSKTREEQDPLGGDKLYRNDGDHFTDVTLEAGIYSSQIGFGLGVSVSDLNGDLWPDIYISNDFWERDYLYLNLQNGTFQEVLTDRIPHTSVSSMGADLADINNDGFVDIFSTDMLAADNYRLKTMTAFDPYHLEDLKYRANYHYQILQNGLQLNNGQAQFQEIGFLSGVASTDWSWGAMVFDFDNDGWKDIYVANGIYHDIMYMDFSTFISDKVEVEKVVKQQGRFDFRDFLPYLPSNPLPNYAFLNQRNLQFKDAAKALGLAEPSFSNGAAYGDLDLDGDQDLVVNNVNMPCFVYQNQSEQTGSHFLRISLKGQGKNTLGIGAAVRIHTGETSQSLQHYTARGFQSSMQPGLIAGLGSSTIVDSLTVSWPGGMTQTLYLIPANSHITLSESEAVPSKPAPYLPSLPLLEALQPFQQQAVHHENAFNDFDTERLLPHMLSTEGPRILHADLNGDQLEEVLLLGSRGQADQIWLQSPAGAMSMMNQPALQADSSFESTCGAFFDADGDGDQDLLLGSGGNDISLGIDAFLLRYYENDGNGIFTKAFDKTPPAAGQMSCIVPEDFDGDGDIDLFIGGRSVPGNYGLVPTSFLFRKDGQQWTAITPDKLAGIGMVTDAVWAHTDGDDRKDLVLVGEWMPVSVCRNMGRELAAPVFVPYSEGWWTRIEAADLDGDGRTDFVLGNWGLNFKLKATPERPLEMFVKDFDANGKSEFILTWFPPLDATSYPFASKPDLQGQLPFLKKERVKYEDYAQLTYETLLSDAQRSGAAAFRAQTLQSSVLWQGEAGFTLQALPLEAQIGPTFGMSIADVNKDNKPDLILGGNFYGLKPELGRLDSHRGVVLLGTGNRSFQAMTSAKSGIWWEGEIRDIVWINRDSDHPFLLVARNHDSLLAYRFSQ
ncbi:MAG: VCBS repeat-containing protein [Bacteroidia bacterium]|nr:VCBS repeat-containing protein [Bacteroidia bacterium]